MLSFSEHTSHEETLNSDTPYRTLIMSPFSHLQLSFSTPQTTPLPYLINILSPRPLGNWISDFFSHLLIFFYFNFICFFIAHLLFCKQTISLLRTSASQHLVCRTSGKQSWFGDTRNMAFASSLLLLESLHSSKCFFFFFLNMFIAV